MWSIHKWHTMYVCARLLQSCPTFCDPMDYRLPDSPLHGILQARILKCVTMPSSRRSSQPRHRTSVFYVSCIGRWVPYHSHHLRSPNGVLLSDKEEWSTDTSYNVDEPWEHHAKEKKPDIKDCPSCML